MAPAMFADLTDYMLNINGTTYCPGSTAATCSSNGGFAAAPSTSSTIDESLGGTGLGTVTVTYDPGGPGTYNVNLWLWEQLAKPGWNEYGSMGGTLAAGESWQIDVPDYQYAGELAPTAAGNIIAKTKASTLGDVNNVPGRSNNFLLDCPVGPTCNDDTSMALGFVFTLGANQEEVLSFTVSTKAPEPNQFYLQQTHPVDDANSPAKNYFFTGTAASQSTIVGAPEPEPLTLLVTMLGGLFWVFRSRIAALKQNQR